MACSSSTCGMDLRFCGNVPLFESKNGSNATRLTRIAEPELDSQNSVVRVRYTILAESKHDGRLTTVREDHYMRYFFPTEINLLAHQTGFTVERSEGFLTGRMPSEATWGVAYLLRKSA